MPIVSVDGLNMNYEVTGTGFPLLLLTGLGYASWSWYKQVPFLSRYFKVITVDNRGAGLTDKPDAPYSIDMMADDVAKLMSTIGIQQTHVLGISMGGFITQTLAINYPHLVERIVLGCTHCGQHDQFVPMQGWVQDMMGFDVNHWSIEKTYAGKVLYFSDEYLRESAYDVDEFMDKRVSNLTPRAIWKRQLQACIQFSARDKLSLISSPTLVAAGDDDPMVPYVNSEFLCKHIAKAEMSRYPRQRHLFFIESSERFNSEVIEFLSRGVCLLPNKISERQSPCP